MNKKSPNECDMFLSQEGSMPINAFVAKYGNLLTDTELGSAIRKNYENYEAKVEANRETWEKEGQEFKSLRERLNIKQKEIAQKIGVHPHTVGNFERGENVRSRDMFKKSSMTAVEFIQLQRNKVLENLTL